MEDINDLLSDHDSMQVITTHSDDEKMNEWIESMNKKSLFLYRNTIQFLKLYIYMKYKRKVDFYIKL